MKTTIIILGVAIGIAVMLVLVTYVIGLFLPADHVAEDERVVHGAPVELVAARIRSVESQPKWRRGVKAIELLPPDNAGGIHYREVGGNGTMSFRLREVTPNRKFESVMTDDALPFGGRWIISIDPVDNGTRLRIREEGTVRPPIFRTLSRFVFGHQSTLKAYLNDLEASLTTEAEPKVNRS
jgi:hypothetical protein